VEQRDVGDGGRDRREAETIRQREERAHVDPPFRWYASMSISKRSFTMDVMS
jgi:hypothetical protein